MSPRRVAARNVLILIIVRGMELPQDQARLMEMVTAMVMEMVTAKLMEMESHLKKTMMKQRASSKTISTAVPFLSQPVVFLLSLLV